LIKIQRQPPLVYTVDVQIKDIKPIEKID